MKMNVWTGSTLLVWLCIGCAGDAKAPEPAAIDNGDESDAMVEDVTPDIENTMDPAEDPDVAYAVIGDKAKVTASVGLHLRTGPSTNDAIILTMPSGAIVDVLDHSNGWYKVTYQSHTGWAYGAYLAPYSSTTGTTRVDRAINRAKTGVHFSYHWGGGCWDPSSSHPGACYGNCPSCTHTGTWGADCSGYVAKVWQVPGATALTTCTHPYSTYNFRYTTAHWQPIARSSAKQGDAFVYHINGEGHVFIYDSGDPWGWMKAYEAKGCSYGIVHDSRLTSGSYIAIRRDGYN
jgi:uncharacterized protein YraI